MPEFKEDTSEKAKKLYMEHWTCGICGKHTHEVDYDYLSGTDHLECVLDRENNKENQTKFLGRFSSQYRTKKLKQFSNPNRTKFTRLKLDWDSGPAKGPTTVLAGTDGPQPSG